MNREYSMPILFKMKYYSSRRAKEKGRPGLKEKTGNPNGGRR
jgi:hypothetical protein